MSYLLHQAALQRAFFPERRTYEGFLSDGYFILFMWLEFCDAVEAPLIWRTPVHTLDDDATRRLLIGFLLGKARAPTLACGQVSVTLTRVLGQGASAHVFEGRSDDASSMSSSSFASKPTDTAPRRWRHCSSAVMCHT